jgi:hypothetical protein
MSGQVAAVSSVSLAVVGAISLAALVFGVADILRLPGWAWKRARRSRTLALVLVIVIPVIGVVIYIFALREAVASLVVGGKAAALEFEGAPSLPGDLPNGSRGIGTVSPPVGFGSFGAASPPVGYNATGAVSPPISHGGPPSFGVRSSLGQQPAPFTQFRPSGPRQAAVAVETAPAPVVPSGWKADPTGRHQFRYWDGYRWTDRVADSGEQSSDPVSA